MDIISFATTPGHTYCYFLHFTDKETEAQKDEIIFSRSQNLQYLVVLGNKPSIRLHPPLS